MSPAPARNIGKKVKVCPIDPPKVVLHSCGSIARITSVASMRMNGGFHSEGL